jgi:hypothetical protein
MVLADQRGPKIGVPGPDSDLGDAPPAGGAVPVAVLASGCTAGAAFHATFEFYTILLSYGRPSDASYDIHINRLSGNDCRAVA